MEKPVRIAHVNGRGAKAGVESVVFNYYRAIDLEKFQFDFIVDEDSPYEIPAEILALGCKVIKIPSYRHLFSYINALKRILPEYKIVHAHMNTLSVFTLFAAKRAGVPVRIAHNHNTAGKGEFLRNALKNILRPFSVVYPTNMFACTEFAGRWLFGKAASRAGKVTVIRNAIDAERFRYSGEKRERVRRELGVSGKYVIGNVGRFVPQKNHTFLLDIFAEVRKINKDAVLLLVGDGELKPAAEKKAGVLGIAEQVMFLGARDDVNELYQAMDVFLLPSLYEGLSVVTVEAQCAGLPVMLTTDVPAAEWVRHLPLSAGAAEWVRHLPPSAGDDRRREISTLSCKEWDIAGEAARLEGIYSDLADGNFKL